MKNLVLVIAIIVGLGARPAHAADDCNLETACTGLLAVSALGFATSGSIPLAGLVTAAGGAARLRAKGWRNANYVLGTLNLLQAMALGITAISINNSKGSGDPVAQPFLWSGVASLAIGAADVGLAIGSAVKSSRPVPRLTVMPLASREMGGVAVGGRF